MVTTKPFKPGEIRAVKLCRAEILRLFERILIPIGPGFFALPPHESKMQTSIITVHFDPHRCEMYLLAHSCHQRLHAESVLSYCQNHSIKITDSLISASKNQVKYHSVREEALFIDPLPDGFGVGNFFTSVRNLFFCNIRPMLKNELRIIRLSQAAVQEILWEHLVSVGDCLFDVTEDTDDIILHMFTDGSFDALTLYAMNIREFSDTKVDTTDDYFRKNMGFVGGNALDGCENGAKYFSVIV